MIKSILATLILFATLSAFSDPKINKTLTPFHLNKCLSYNDTFPKKISLSEIVIKGKKPPITFKIDRQVFNASQFSNASNGNAMDVIKNIPSVSVNGQGEINVRGSSSFLILINGKTTQGDPSFVLSQLPASIIESIEFISSPGASYDAEGRNGIINIIIKSALEKGLLIQSNLMNGTPPFNDYGNARNKHPQRRSADLSISYQHEKWDISMGINFLQNDIAGRREGDVLTIRNNFKTTFPSLGERSFKRYNYGGRFAATYSLNDKNKIEAAAYLGKRYQSRVADLVYINQRTNLSSLQNAVFSYFNKNTQEKEGVFSLVSLNSKHQINKKTDLVLSTQYEGANLKGLTTNDNLSYPGFSSVYQTTLNPSTNPLDAYRLKADLTKKNNLGLLQMGYQYRYDIQHGDFNYYYRNQGYIDFTYDPSFSSKLSIKNHIHAGYLQYSNVKDSWSYQFGMRAEQMLRNLAFSQNNNTQKRRLLNLFPSYLVRYSINEKQSLKTGFSRRIKRTNNFELNPFPEREHSETLEQGDPDLLPELTANWELGMENKIKNGNFFITLYYQRIKNPIQRVNKVYNDTILNRVFTNAQLARQLGIETNLTYKINSKSSFTVGGNIFKYDIKGNIFNGLYSLKNNSWVYSINATQNFTFEKNWSFQFNLNYLSLRATVQGKDGAFLTPNMSIRKISLDKRWTFLAQWLFMDAGLGISNKQRISTWGKDFYNMTNYIYETDQIQFSIGFNLTRKNRKINLPQSEMAEKEF